MSFFLFGLVLNHVASQSLGTSHHVSFHASNTDMADLGFSAHHFKHGKCTIINSPENIVNVLISCLFLLFLFFSSLDWVMTKPVQIF